MEVRCPRTLKERIGWKSSDLLLVSARCRSDKNSTGWNGRNIIRIKKMAREMQ